MKYMEKFKVIIVEDVPLELKGTEGIFRADIPEADIIGTAQTEVELWHLLEAKEPDLLLLDLGLGGSTTVGIDICRQMTKRYPQVKTLIFTGEILNEKLWVDALDAGAVGVILKTGEMLTREEVADALAGHHLVFNRPILEKIVQRFRESILSAHRKQSAVIDYEIDEYDERLLRHLALGYTKDMIANLQEMPFSIKTLEKRQNDLVTRLFSAKERAGVNAIRLVVRAMQLNIIDLYNLHADDE